MDAALRLIAEDGYRSVTVEAVAREAGVTKPVVYSAFDGLDRLLGTLLERQQARALLNLFDALPLDEPGIEPAAFVDRSVRAWIEVVTSDPLTWSPILTARQGTPDVVWQRIEQGRDVVRKQLASLIAGRLPEGADPVLMSHALLAMAEHFGRLLLTDPGTVDVDKLVSTVQAVLGVDKSG